MSELFDLLKRFDTPTICNAIEVVQGRRGFDNFTRGTMVASNPAAPAMVGYARTARLAARRPPEEPPEVIRERRMNYYRYMARQPQPAVAVVEDTDYPDCIGAYWGEINVTVHKGFGIAGALTNGVVRDLGDLPAGFPVVAGSVGPSHGFVHVLDYDEPVTVMGLRVKPGDLIHADRHGAVVIPDEVIDELPKGIEKLLASERIVLDAAKSLGFDIAAFEEAWARFEKVRT